MSFAYRLAAWAVLLFAVAPLGAQERTVVLSGMAGGYNQLRGLDAAGGPDFRTGGTVGASAGVQIGRFAALHWDLAWARSTARGNTPFAGVEFNRYFWGAHLELRVPVEGGFAPFVFAGGGGVTVDPTAGVGTLAPAISASAIYFPSVDEPALRRFTKPAGMFGLGVFYAAPGSPVELFFEAKTVVFRWTAARYNRMQADLTYGLGLSYRIRVG